MQRILIIALAVGVLLSAAGPFGAFKLAALAGVGTVNNRPGGEEYPATASHGTAGWEIETVYANAAWYDSACSLALDRRGRPHIAYFYRREAPYLQYARWDGKRWLTRTVDASVKMWSCDLKLALDDRGWAHIVYNYSVDAPGGGERKLCKYARWTGKEWDIRDVVTDVKYEGNVDLVLDEEGRVHIAYVRDVDGSDETRRELTYAQWDGNAWTREVLAVLPGYGGGVRVVLNAEGEPRVLNGGQYFLPKGGRWRERVIPYDFPYGFGPSALDASDRLHFAFKDAGLVYGRQTESGWKKESVDVKWGAGSGASLALDCHGLPYISYLNSYDLCFAHFTGEEWVVHTVEGFGRPAEHYYDTSLALDDEGRPVIAYFDGLSGALKCARWRGGEWRNPPPAEANKSKDLTAAGEIVSWYLQAAAFLPEDPRHPRWLLNRDNIHVAPDGQAEVLLRIREPTEGELLDARSVRKSHGDMAGETWASYEAWVEVKVGDVVGWVPASRFFLQGYSNPALVRFAKPYAPLREGPSEEAPVAREDVKPGDRWRVGTSAAAGQYFFLKGKVADWYCLERGYSAIWAPADAPGLELFYLTYAWEPTDDAGFWFYLPGTDEIDRVFYLVDTYRASGGLPWKDPRLEVVVAGETFELVPRENDYSGGYECVDYYFEFTFPHPVRRDDIEAITLSVGDEGERVHFTVDPREAWRKPATEYRWPSRGMA